MTVGVQGETWGWSHSLARTDVKAAAYQAAAGELVPVDTTSGAVTITLPNAPADRTQVAIKHVVQGGSNTVTIACVGTDVFNKIGGSTTGTLTLVNQAMLLQYDSGATPTTPGIWTVLADDLPLSDLDARYQGIGTYAALTDFTTFQTQVPTLEELERALPLPNTAISATTTIYDVATNFNLRVGAITFCFSAAIAASDTDFWTVALQRIRANGTAVTLATQTTKVTGGVAIAANTAWTFDNATWPSTLRYLLKGDRLRVVFTKTGAPSNLADPSAAIRYEPGVRPTVYDSFTRNDASVLGTADSGQLWTPATVYTGTQSVFGIKSNQASVVTSNASGGPRDWASLDSGLADCTVGVVILATTVGIAFRVSQDGSGHVNGFTANTTALFRADAGSPGALTSILTFTAAYVAGDTMTFVLSGSTITAYKNGVANGSVTDANYLTNTRHGLRASSPATGVGLWDDFIVAA